MTLSHHLKEGVPSAADDVAVTLELVVLEVVPIDFTSTVLAEIPAVEPVIRTKHLFYQMNAYLGPSINQLLKQQE